MAAQLQRFKLSLRSRAEPEPCAASRLPRSSTINQPQYNFHHLSRHCTHPTYSQCCNHEYVDQRLHWCYQSTPSQQHSTRSHSARNTSLFPCASPAQHPTPHKVAQTAQKTPLDDVWARRRPRVSPSCRATSSTNSAVSTPLRSILTYTQTRQSTPLLLTSSPLSHTPTLSIRIKPDCVVGVQERNGSPAKTAA